MAARKRRVVALFWDVENVQIPKGTDPGELARNLGDFANAFGTVVQSCAYTGHTKLTPAHRDGLYSAGVDVVHCPVVKEAADKKIITSILFWCWDTSRGTYGGSDMEPPCVILVTADHDFCHFLAQLTNRGIHTVLITNGTARDSLRHSVKECHHFDKFLHVDDSAPPTPTAAAQTMDVGTIVNNMQYVLAQHPDGLDQHALKQSFAKITGRSIGHVEGAEEIQALVELAGGEAFSAPGGGPIKFKPKQPPREDGPAGKGKGERATLEGGEPSGPDVDSLHRLIVLTLRTVGPVHGGQFPQAFKDATGEELKPIMMRAGYSKVGRAVIAAGGMLVPVGPGNPAVNYVLPGHPDSPAAATGSGPALAEPAAAAPAPAAAVAAPHGDAAVDEEARAALHALIVRTLSEVPSVLGTNFPEIFKSVTGQDLRPLMEKAGYAKVKHAVRAAGGEGVPVNPMHPTVAVAFRLIPPAGSAPADSLAVEPVAGPAKDPKERLVEMIVSVLKQEKNGIPGASFPLRFRELYGLDLSTLRTAAGFSRLIQAIEAAGGESFVITPGQTPVGFRLPADSPHWA